MTVSGLTGIAVSSKTSSSVNPKVSFASPEDGKSGTIPGAGPEISSCRIGLLRGISKTTSGSMGIAVVSNICTGNTPSVSFERRGIRFDIFAFLSRETRGVSTARRTPIHYRKLTRRSPSGGKRALEIFKPNCQDVSSPSRNAVGMVFLPINLADSVWHHFVCCPSFDFIESKSGESNATGSVSGRPNRGSSTSSAPTGTAVSSNT